MRRITSIARERTGEEEAMRKRMGEEEEGRGDEGDEGFG